RHTSFSRDWSSDVCSSDLRRCACSRHRGGDVSKRIFFNEVVTRDGFQIEPGFIPTDAKVQLVDALSDCGYAKIEATSFTSPKAKIGRASRRAGEKLTTDAV